MKSRLDRLLPAGLPRYVHCYDNGGESIDRYTVVFTGRYAGRDRRCDYLGMSGAPFHPQGFCQHGEADRPIDYPTYGHLGKKIAFALLPAGCQRAVMNDYIQLWGFVRCACCGTIVEDRKSWGDGDVGDYYIPSYCTEKCYRSPTNKVNKRTG